MATKTSGHCFLNPKTGFPKTWNPVWPISSWRLPSTLDSLQAPKNGSGASHPIGFPATIHHWFYEEGENGEKAMPKGEVKIHHAGIGESMKGTWFDITQGVHAGSQHCLTFPSRLLSMVFFRPLASSKCDLYFIFSMTNSGTWGCTWGYYHSYNKDALKSTRFSPQVRI